MREPLTVDQLVKGLTRVSESRAREITRIAVPVECIHATLGPRPTVQIVDFSNGFDWDRGTLFLHPSQPLTALTPDELAEVKKCRAEGQSWVMCKAHERWQGERDALVENINKLRTALLQRGMSTDELAELAGEAPTARPRRGKRT
ncbi:hypothetical protein GTB64_004423 [Salmonella enterica]|nr:hypothetical protein [Salmonella enterica]